MEIKLISENQIEWYSKTEKQVIAGTSYTYVIYGCDIWYVQVKIPDNKRYAEVSTYPQISRSLIHEQLKTKSSLLKEMDKCHFYYLLGKGYFDKDAKRVRRKRISDTSEIPREIRKKYVVKKMDELKDVPKQFGDKYVAIVSKETPQDIAHIFYFCMINPLEEFIQCNSFKFPPSEKHLLGKLIDCLRKCLSSS